MEPVNSSETNIKDPRGSLPNKAFEGGGGFVITLC